MELDLARNKTEFLRNDQLDLKRREKLQPTLNLKAFLTFFILSMPFIILTFWALIDLMRLQTKAVYTKFLWLVVVVLVPYIGGLGYLLFGRRLLRRKEEDNV